MHSEYMEPIALFSA